MDAHAVGQFVHVRDDDVGPVGEVGMMFEFVQRAFGAVNVAVRAAVHAQAAINAAGLRSPGVGDADGDAGLAELDAGAGEALAILFEPGQKHFRLLAQVERGGILAVEREKFFEIIAPHRQPGDLQHGRVMRRELGVAHRPVGDVPVRVRQHRRAPDVAESAFGEGRLEADAVVVRWQVFVGFAVRKIRTINPLQRDSFSVGGGSFLDPADLFRGPGGSGGGGHFGDGSGAGRFEGNTGVEKENLCPALDQGQSARDASGTGADDHVG